MKSICLIFCLYVDLIMTTWTINVTVTCHSTSLKRNMNKFYLLLQFICIIWGCYYGSVENTAKLNNTNLVMWNSRKSMSDTSNCNIIGHRSAASRAILTAGVTHCTIQKDPYYETHYINRHTAKDAKYTLTQWYTIFLNCRPRRHGW